MSELVSLVEIKEPSLITGASQRFSYQAGILADLNEKLKSSEKNNIKIIFDDYKKYFQNFEIIIQQTAPIGFLFNKTLIH